VLLAPADTALGTPADTVLLADQYGGHADVLIAQLVATVVGVSTRKTLGSYLRFKHRLQLSSLDSPIEPRLDCGYIGREDSVAKAARDPAKALLEQSDECVGLASRFAFGPTLFNKLFAEMSHDFFSRRLGFRALGRPKGESYAGEKNKTNKIEIENQWIL
jgi:hypothetical protein